MIETNKKWGVNRYLWERTHHSNFLFGYVSHDYRYFTGVVSYLYPFIEFCKFKNMSIYNYEKFFPLVTN